MPLNRELNFEGKKPLLYLLATPIGNMQEVSPRFLEVAQSMDFIACEDTRNSGSLLSKLKIDKPLISCHEHNEEQASDKIISLLKDGKKVAYMSDAGYPAISDPGERLVKRCLKEGIKVSVVNGPSASIAALVVSGLDTSHFYFEGFLPAKASERDAELKALSSRHETIIFYEAPHRIKATLEALSSLLGKDREASLARELTKAHEEIIHGTLEELSLLDETTLKGEMVIVVAGAKTLQKTLSDEEIQGLLKEKLLHVSRKEAIKSICDEYDVPKNRVYALSLKI